MDQYIGKWLDNRYELLERIGTGGMAVVYKARCHRLNRLVAVKILKPELADDAEFRRRFQDESRAVAMLSHPNIVSVYDVSRSDNLNYIVMELIDGITLKQYMQRRGTPLNWREALHFITQIMKALSHAHSRGIIHRDIKPHNVMVLRDGSVKVADFGIARLISSGQNTLTQEALGSVHYISPEQARGSQVDGRSDIYSAGVVLYEMITGRLPYEGDSPVAVAIQHINSAPIPPRELNPEVPEALEAITLKAMDPDVSRRYASADEMLADLEEFRKNPNITFSYDPTGPESEEESAGEPTQVVTVTHPRIEGEDSGRYRRAADTGSFRRREEEEYDDEPPRRGFPVILISVLVICLFVAGIGWFIWTSFLAPLVMPATDTYVVPELTGKTMDEIYQDKSITDVWSINLANEYVASDRFDYGQVAQQEPSAKTVVRNNNLTITVFLSRGKDDDTVRMPSLTNKDVREARDELTRLELDLVIQESEQESVSVTKGYVISTDPAMGTELVKGQSVTLVVSVGQKILPATVPTLTNMPLEDALNSITRAKLTLQDVRRVSSDTVPEGTVVDQSLTPGDEVPEGTGIILQVSTGPVVPVQPDDPGPTGDPEPSQSQDPVQSGDPEPSQSEDPVPSQPEEPDPDFPGPSVPEDPAGSQAGEPEPEPEPAE